MKKVVIAAVLSTSLMTAPAVAQEAPVADPFTSSVGLSLISFLTIAGVTSLVILGGNSNDGDGGSSSGTN